MDPRVHRTKQMLSNALVALIREKSLARLSVAQLTSAAGINRATFYRHYQSIETFVEEITDDLLNGLVDSHQLDARESIDGSTYYRSWLEFAHDHRELFNALLSMNGSPEFRIRLVQNGIDSWSYVLGRNKTANLSDREIRFISTYITSAHVGVLTQWLAEGCATPIDEMCEEMYRLSIRGVMNACFSQQDRLPH